MRLIDLLAKEIRESASYNSNVQVAPSVILWTDKQGQWQSALPLLQAAMPELIVLGEYAPQQRTGPAIWIKCVVDGVLPEINLPSDRVPIVYLPGVERRDLRAIATCPDELMPLAELQYRGCWWVYNNSGRDWTVNAFLTSDNGGLGLDVAKDEKSQQAMLRVLQEILGSKREDLANRRLEASDFNKLVSNDPIRDVLTWMNNPKGSRENWDTARWEALVGICEAEYHFHPERDGELVAAERLCQRQGIWETVWQRYAESYHLYKSLFQLLLRVEGDLAADGTSYPIINQSQESELEGALTQLQSLSPDEIRKQLIKLEHHHAGRRDWIWFKQDKAQLAGVLYYLSRVAELTQRVFAGSDPEEMAQLYKEKYWQVDDLVLKALAFAPLPLNHQGLVQKLLALIYTPWLDEVTHNFQNLVKAKGYPGTKVGDSQLNEAIAPYLTGGELVFFVDGLRYDLGQRLFQRLQPSGEVKLLTNWAALPSVTATAKAAVTPVHDRLTGRITDRDFEPSLLDGETKFSAYYLKKFLKEKGWSYLETSDIGNPGDNAWVQSGDIDMAGHAHGLKLAAQADELLKEIVERLEELLAAGWKKIRIVTDHGWLLTPEAMPKVDLPKYLTETRWGRCAVIKDSIESGFLHVGWYWNHQVNIAMAPGISCFKAGQFYDHGGLSLQECLTPVIEITNTKKAMAGPTISATLSEVRWIGLSCRVQADTSAEGVIAVLRLHAADSGSEISKRKALKDGKCTLMVEDEYEDKSAVLVLLDEQDIVLARKPTLVGDV